MTDLFALGSPRVRITTDYGDLLIDLYPDRAPTSVAAFLTEAREGSFNGGKFGRVVRPETNRSLSVIQGYSSDSVEGRLDVEFETTEASGLLHEDGAVSLPRGDGRLATAQSFFVCIGAQPQLDASAPGRTDSFGYGVFGKVVDGMDVVRAIQALPTLNDAPIERLKGQVPVDPPVIQRIAIESARDG